MSDDSASDLESVQDVAPTEPVLSGHGGEYDAKSRNLDAKDNVVRSFSTPYDPGILHGDSIAKSSPIKVEGTRRLKCHLIQEIHQQCPRFKQFKAKIITLLERGHRIFLL